MMSDKRLTDTTMNGSGLRATTIGTVVIRGGPIQMVIALLQSDNNIYIKVVEIEPKLTALGENIDEAVGLQRQHEELIKQIKDLPTPLEDFGRKTDKLLTTKRINAEIVSAMGQTLEIVWDDVLKLIHDRKHILNLCSNFHEKMGTCRGKMASLEVACKDTMIPIEVEAVQDFLNKFKQLRIDMLTSVMSALKEGNELLSQLEQLLELNETGTLDSRPEHLKKDTLRAVKQVQSWLENLHDRRNLLEAAWQTRKTQLEQCLAIAILANDLTELENNLKHHKSAVSAQFSLGECEHTSGLALKEYSRMKHDALLLRDRALKITRATEKLVTSGCFAGNEACTRAYKALSFCNEYFELCDLRERLLHQSKDFFMKAEKTLSVLEKLEIELSQVKLPPNAPETFAMYSKVLHDLRAFTEEPLKLGYLILEDVGRTKYETQGVKRVLEEIENRKIYIEKICSQNTEEQVKIQKILTSFLEQYNEICTWLVEIVEKFIKKHYTMGLTVNEAKNFLLLHHKMLQDLEFKGEYINNLLEEIKKYLESLEPQQRYEVDTKADSLHKHWTELKDIVLKRVDLVSIYIAFLEKAEALENRFSELNDELSMTADENKLNYLENQWDSIKECYANLKKTAGQFISVQIADPYLEAKSAYQNVEEILKSLSNRQFDLTTNWEKYTTNVFERKEIEILLERIMSDNTEISNKTTKLDTQLYPIFTSESLDAKQLQNEIKIKLECVVEDVDTALEEIQQRIDTTLQIQTTDYDYVEKIGKIVENLRILKQKLDSIRSDYKMLVENIMNFLENIQILHEQIDEYLIKTTSNQDHHNVKQQQRRNLLAEHEIYREKIMEKFRTLISQSELLIERIRLLEPAGAKEYDTDRILKLLENLRFYFEKNNTNKMIELEKYEEFNRFKENLSEIDVSLDQVYKQLNDITKQNVENLANAKTSSLAFEYFERTIELLEKRIDNFIISSELTTNSDTENNIKNDLNNLRNKWEQFKDQVRLTRKSLNLSNEYFEIIEKIDCETREISYFYSSVANKIPFLREPVQATNLLNDIETYIQTREGPLKEKLKRASQLSHEAYKDDRTKSIQNDVSSIFQSFVKLKSDISIACDRLKNEEKHQEELKRRQEQHKEQQLLLEHEASKQKQQQLMLQQQAEQQRAQQLLLQQQLQDQERQHQLLIQQKDEIKKQQLMLQQQQEEQKRLFLQQAEERHKVQLQNQRDEIDRASNCVEKVKKTTTTTTSNQMFDEPKYLQPKFIRQLYDSQVGEGDHFIFNCEVIGEPEPKIEWFKDGISISNNSDYKTKYDKGHCELQIDETLQADSGQFSCKASNLVGTDCTFARLSVRENAIEAQMIPPQILKYLQPGVAHEGGSHEFRCTVTGSPLPTVQWYKNDKCIDDSQDYHITFNNGEAVLRLDQVFLEDNAVYTVNISNPAGFIQCSANLNVEPLEPTEVPRFIVPLTNVMARVGQKIRLECQITGIPQPTFKWMHNDKPYFWNDAKYEDGRLTLIIPAAYPKDSGIYTCIISNLAGQAYSSCNVNVKGRLPNETSDSEMASDIEPIRPSVQLALKNVSIFESKSVRMDCIIIGQPEPEVIWYHNDVPVKESPDIQLLFQGDRCSLIIQEAYIDDAGTYKIVAINSAGETSSSCVLTVTPLNITEPAQRMLIVNQSQTSIEIAPRFEKFLSDVLVNEGDTIELECIASGDKPLNAKWYLSNKELFESNRVKFKNDDNGIFKLQLSNCTQDDKGVYTVKISNNAGDAKCFSHLIVKSINTPPSVSDAQIEDKYISPSFKELFTDKNVHPGDVVKFECIVQGKPTPKIKWLFNEQPVQGKNFLISTSGNRQVLTIPETSVETVGRISCLAENEVGKATCMASLNMIGEGLEFPSSVNHQSISQEHNTESSRVTIKKQTFTTTSTSQVNSYEGNIPQTQIHIASTNIDQALKQLNDHKPEIVESHHYEEFRKTSEIPGAIEQKSVVLIQNSDQKAAAFLPESPKKFTRKNIAPRFSTPLIGKIVNQGSNVCLEAIYDGYPSPEIKIQKNGEDILSNDKVKISNNFHKVNIEVLNVNVHDAGRYSVTASNSAGQSTSTADVVVKKTIFPPVFGHRLQAQVVKRGERVVMETEVSGTPDPTVTWYKDGKPLRDILSPHVFKLRAEGNRHTLIIERAEPNLAGKYMVKATNAGGEAQSIADFAILEPTPERFIEIVKTTVYDDQKGLQELNLKKEPLSFQTTKIEQSVGQDLHGTSESKIITEHQCTTEATMRLEHKPTYFDMPELGRQTPKSTVNEATSTDNQQVKNDFTQTPPQLLPKSEALIESSSISQKSSYEFFKKIEASEPPLELFPKLSELQQSIQTLPKLIPLQKPLEPVVSEADLIKLNLVPGTPPEMCFCAKPELPQRQTISDKIKKLGEIKHQGEPPSGGVQILPHIFKNVEEIKNVTNFVQSSTISNGSVFRPQANLSSPTPILTRSPSPKPSAEGVAMEKLWASKPVDYESGFSDYEESKHHTYTPISEAEQIIEPPKTLQDTKKIFEAKIQEQTKKFYQSAQKFPVDLKAPSLVKQFMKPKPIEIQKPQIADIQLQPGTPPEFCFAPKSEERRRSLVEVMEETLEQSLQKGPSRVVPHSVPTFAPPLLPPKDYSTIAPAVPRKPTPAICITPPPEPQISTPKFVRSEIYESDYESDRWKYYSGSESDEPFLKNIKPPTPIQKPKLITENISIIKPIPKISGYVADTEETSSYHTFTSQEARQHIFESQSSAQQQSQIKQTTTQQQQPYYPPILPNAEVKGHTQHMIKNISINSKNYKIREEPEVLEPFPFVAEHQQQNKVKVPPPPSPSKFMKGEFRGSEYSDTDERYSTLEEKGYRPVHPNLTPTSGRQSNISMEGFKSPTPPCHFEQPPILDGPPRPRFEPIQHEQIIKIETVPQKVHKPKPVAAKFIESISQRQQEEQTQQKQIFSNKKEIITRHQINTRASEPPPSRPQAQPRTQYYRGIAGVPMHHASMATETRNTMHMKESSETCSRIVNMEQTKRIIHFDEDRSLNQQKESVLEPFPFSTSSASNKSYQKVPPPATPSKFIRGEFRESDYESEIENARNTPLWNTSLESRFRHVEPPRGGGSRSASLPRSYEHIISPLEFDHGPQMPRKIIIDSPVKSYQTQTMNRFSASKQIQSNNMTRDDMNLNVGSPPKYSYIADHVQKQANEISSSIKKKSSKFINDISEDFKRTNDNTHRLGFKRAPSEGENRPQAYRNESRMSQYGTKCIDPNTGLIYFKYDFGYEFGILFPGEGRKFIAASNSVTSLKPTKKDSEKPAVEVEISLKNKYPLRNMGDINIPVQHIRSTKRSNNRPLSFASDGEFSESESIGGLYNIKNKRYSLPLDYNLEQFNKNRLDGHYFLNSQSVSEAKSTIPVNVNSNQEHPKRPPVFITPLKDIAVVIGQGARFECIVQCDPHPNVQWSKNGDLLENSNKHIIEFRNGVCRLTIPQIYPDDSGTYSCTGSNELGSITSTAELIVPGNTRQARY